MLLLTKLQAAYPAVPLTGTWYLMDMPPGLINLNVDNVCATYNANSTIGTTPTPNVQFNCPSPYGDYKFEYRVLNCGTLLNYTLIVNNADSPEASIEKVYTGTPCTVNAIIVNTTDATQSLQLLWASNSFTPSINGRLVITDTCGGPPIISPVTVPTTNNVVTLPINIAITDYTGYVKTVRLKNSASTFNIDVSITSPYLSFAGSPYTVNPSDLIFSVAFSSPLVYATALQNLLLNAIHSLTGSQTNMCPFGVTTITNGVRLRFTSKNVPSATYTGMLHTDAYVETYQSSGTVVSSSGTAIRNITIYNTPIVGTGTTSCGNVVSVTNTLTPPSCSTYTVLTAVLPPNGAPYSLNVNYNVIDLGTYRFDTDGCSASGNFACPGNTLTLKAVTTPPCPNATYLWSTAATTQTIVPPGAGTYSVTLTCDTCSDTASITI